MIIRPGKETFAHELLSCDPLYLVDESHELLQPVMDTFTEAYQHRVRPYVINERQPGKILEKIPNNQFGLVFAYNFFHYKPLEVIRRYVEEIFIKLRPGGVLVMTINDCDRDYGVKLVEDHYCCYTPGHMIKELCRSVGYEISAYLPSSGPVTWIELKKPGTMTSLRGGQSLAKIVNKVYKQS
jgi:SAM-dependent methyltransferase